MTTLYQNFNKLLIVTVAVMAGVAHANLASVNGKVITNDDLNRVVSNLPELQKNAILKDQHARSQLLQNLIDQEVLFQEASAKKIEQSKEYKEALENFKRQTLVNMLLQRQIAGKVNDAAAKDYYSKNRFLYSTDQVRAQHILVNSEAEAKAIMAEVKKPGVDFQALAEKRSKDPSAKNNRGDVGYFTREMFDPAFSNAAFGGKPNEIVGPVKTTYGFHVIKVIDRKNGKTPEFVEVEARVRSDVQKQLVLDYVNQLKRKAKIKQ